MPKKIRVLVVEDDHYVQRSYVKFLESEGFEVSVAGDGEKGLSLLKTEKPDIVLLDLIIPRISGFEFLANKKANKDVKDIPVIVISNLDQESDIRKGMEFGAVDYLAKSELSLDEIKEKINKYVGA